MCVTIHFGKLKLWQRLGSCHRKLSVRRAWHTSGPGWFYSEVFYLSALTRRAVLSWLKILELVCKGSSTHLYAFYIRLLFEVLLSHFYSGHELGIAERRNWKKSVSGQCSGGAGFRPAATPGFAYLPHSIRAGLAAQNLGSTSVCKIGLIIPSIVFWGWN